MKNTVKLKPSRSGLLVKDPASRIPLPESGAYVQLTTYWRRRLRDGSVVEVKATKAALKKPTPKP